MQTDPVRNRPEDQSGAGMHGASGVTLRNGTASNDQNSTNSIPNPAESALVDSDSATTKAGKPRQRMKWSTQMNKDVMRCYFKATNLENELTSYRGKMHELFLNEYPNITITEQRVADQRRTIMARSLLPQAIIDEIKEQVRKEISQKQEEITPDDIYNQNRNQNQHETIRSQNQNEQTNNQCEHDPLATQTEQKEEIPPDANYFKELEAKLNEIFIKYCGTDPTQRPQLPRQSSSKKLAIITAKVNQLLPSFIKNIGTFEELHALLYSAAMVCATENGAKIKLCGRKCKKQATTTPQWQIRLEKKVANLRSSVNRLHQYQNGNNTKRLEKEIQNIFKKHKIHSKHEETNDTVDEYMDTLKQKLTATAKRLRRYKETDRRKKENKMFKERESIFYRKLNNNENKQETPPTEDIIKYWKKIWSESTEYNKEASWIKAEQDNMHGIMSMEHHQITIENLRSAIKNTQNWKAPGSDQIHNYWLKKFTNAHTELIKYFNTFIDAPHRMPTFLAHGLTFLIPKKGDSHDPANYRPITCLQAIYKIYTSCISQLIYNHCEQNSILTEQQKGCKKSSQGCKEQLIIDSVIMNQARTNVRNIYTAYIDYRKAFDSVPHDWLIEILKIYKISRPLINFLSHCMENWQTTLIINRNEEKIRTGEVKIKRGIYQGDSLSPLWFCLSLNPLSNILNNTNKGYVLQKRGNYQISHLLYMDDIKIYSGSRKDLEHNMEIIEMFSNDIKMTFGLDKCKTQSIHKGKRELIGFQLANDGGLIEGMEEGEVYRYLGIAQARVIEETTTKLEIGAKYEQRVKQIARTKLNGKNMIKAINTYAIPLLSYTFGIIHWTATDINNIKRKTSKILSEYRYHHKNSAVERLTLPRYEGGRGLVDISNLLNNQKTLLKEYFLNKAEHSPLYNAVVKADKAYTPLNMSTLDSFPTVSNAEKINSWLQKTLHGKHRNMLNQPKIDIKASNAWLTNGDLFPETEGFMCAIQDQVINTPNYKKYIIKDGTQNDTCRRCHGAAENIHHIISGCQAIANSDYKNRHDNVAKILHEALAHKYLLSSERIPYYKYLPNAVTESENVKMYWDRTIITDTSVTHNRPDIVLFDKLNSQVFLIDIAVPDSTNLLKTEEEKTRKYMELSYEIKDQWKVNKVSIIPIVISATGVIPHSLHQSICKLNLPQNIYIKMQKSVILSTCNIVRKYI